MVKQVEEIEQKWKMPSTDQSGAMLLINFRESCGKSENHVVNLNGDRNGF